MRGEILRAAKADEVAEIDRLMIGAKDQIGLSDGYCDTMKAAKRIEWLNKQIGFANLWVAVDAEGLAGVLIAGPDCRSKPVDRISYLIVAERLRGKRRVGPLLVQHAKLLAEGGFLEVEARNKRSQRLLKRCRFQSTGNVSYSGHPILNWRVDFESPDQSLGDTPSPHNSGENEE